MIYDLTHTINSEIPVFPGSENVRIKNLFSIDADGYSEKYICLPSHAGTHIDAPAHMVKNGKTLDEYHISDFTGKAVLIDISAACPTVPDELPSYLADSNFVIFRTGWSRFWKQAGYFHSYPVPSDDIIRLICSFNLKGVGIDTASIDSSGSSVFENHARLFSENMLIIENLNRLEQITSPVFMISALPLLISQSDGSPARVTAEF